MLWQSVSVQVVQVKSTPATKARRQLKCNGQRKVYNQWWSSYAKVAVAFVCSTLWHNACDSLKNVAVPFSVPCSKCCLQGALVLSFAAYKAQEAQEALHRATEHHAVHADHEVGPHTVLLSAQYHQALSLHATTPLELHPTHAQHLAVLCSLSCIWQSWVH